MKEPRVVHRTVSMVVVPVDILLGGKPHKILALKGNIKTGEDGSVTLPIDSEVILTGSNVKVTMTEEVKDE